MTITLKQHPLGALLPALSEQEMSELAEDIKDHGQVEFITLHEGKVLDGWQRYQACLRAGVEPKTTKFNGKDAKAFVWSKTLRRNLSAGQKAQLAVALNPPLEKGRPELNGENSPFKSNAELAEQIGVDPTTIKQARKVEAEGSAELKQAVIDGDISVSAAAKVTDLPKAKQAAAARKPKPKKEKSAPNENAPDMVKELEAADKQIRSLQELVETLQKSDLAKELTKQQLKYEKLEGRLQLAITQKNEADKQARYSTGLLAQIRKALKVEKNSEILEAIRQS